MSRIDNLGDYNKVRVDLQNVGGNRDSLYKEIGNVAVAKAAPKLMLKGGLIGGALVGIIWIGTVGVGFFKDRREKMEREENLREEFYKLGSENTTKKRVT